MDWHIFVLSGLLFLHSLPVECSSTDASDQHVVVASLDLSPETSRLLHLQVSSSTGHVLVSGVNRIFQLSADLRRLETVVTGPQQDSSECSASGCEPSIVTRSTDNYNKLLVVDEESRTLLSCGSLHQGACVKYELTNVSWPSQALPQAVAANDPNSSTVAFIGPEHYSDQWGPSNVLYVATTFTLVGNYRNNVPAISTRNLQDLGLAERSITKHSMMSIDVKYRDHFRVEYVYGFNTSTHAYFLTVQRQSHLPGQHEKGYISRIVRACISDANYDSYVEMTLSCGEANLLQAARFSRTARNLARDPDMDDGEHILVASFSTSEGYSKKPQSGASVCVYPIKTIERMFDGNIHMCYNGSMQYRNMEYISGPILNGKCPHAGTSGNIQDFCSRGLKISAQQPLSMHPVTSFSERVTSVTITSTGRHTVALLGTELGTLKKILLSPGIESHQFGEIQVEQDSAILSDTAMDSTGNHLYVITAHKVSKLKVATCGHYNNCSSCLTSMNPYCGWCSLESRCTVQEKCINARFYSPRWLTFDNKQQCIDIEEVVPASIPINQQAEVSLKIRALPTLPTDGRYQCVFGTAPPVYATPTSIGLRCRSPPIRLRPFVKLPSDHATVPLTVRSSETSRDFVSAEFVYYDCGRHDNCGGCVTASWSCHWCLYDNKCVHNQTTCARQTIPSAHGENMSPVNLGCPSIMKPTNPILIANGVGEHVVVEVANLPAPSPDEDSYTCVVEFEGKTSMVPARVDSERYVKCDKHRYEYAANASSLEANITVIWNYNHPIGTAQVTLYKCGHLATHQGAQDCSLCLSSTHLYRCSWCGNECLYREQCTQPSLTACPKPQIDKIYPTSGPLEGGTLLTIEGRNLGLTQREMAGKIFVGDVPCQLVDYQISVRVVCKTGPVDFEREERVQIASIAGSTESNLKFHYLRVGIMGVYPTYGPLSGGTTLTLIGTHLDTGSQLLVSLDGLPCHVTSRSPNISCVTSAAAAPGMVSTLFVWLDRANRSTFTTFSYRPDPVLLDVRPLRSYFSGGRLLTIHGEHLDSVQSPKMMVYNSSSTRPVNITNCRIISNQLMECPSPSVINLAIAWQSETKSRKSTRTAAWYQSPSAMPSDDQNIYLKMGFVMDNVESVKDMDKFFPNVPTTLMYVSDPIVFPFASQRKIFNGNTLVIEGSDLTMASDSAEISVIVGGHPCNVTSLTASQIVCVPPLDQPEGDDTGLPAVLVSVGSVQFTLGHLQYDDSPTFVMSPSVVGGIAGGSVLLILMACLILLVYRRKSSQVEREYKRIQIQMDTLENNIRSECKQSFAAMCTWDPHRGRDALIAACPDLRTQLNNMINQFSAEEVACVEQREFLRKVLFPGISDHPIFSQGQYSIVTPYGFGDIALTKLDRLLKHQQFVVSFIDTLERQKDFNVRDRVTVASLLSVILLSDMEYMTCILHVLLKKHINKLAQTKHPHLMLRRTETVVEKLLTNWISLCLYSYIQTKLAPPLHLLTKAVKCQIDGGPVDAITQEAQFSIAEERLLHEHVDFHPVTLLVTAEELPYDRISCTGSLNTSRLYEDVVHRATVYALNCDAVSQAKQKIIGQVFSSVPSSMRPSHHSFTLLWQRGDGQRIVMLDEDGSTRTDSGWRRLNTLEHYGIINIATVSLVHARDTLNLSGYLPSSSSGLSVPSSFSPLSTSNIYMKPGCEPRVYHLIRPPTSPDTYSRKSNTVPEVFLTRQLSNKAMLQWFVDNVMTAFFTVDDGFPSVIKWLFDTLDEEAKLEGISDPEVLHSWKSNCLPLRLWANLVRRPELVFDMDKSAPVEASLAVISQSLVEACLPAPQNISKDSPAYRLLFAKDVSRWRELVAGCFEQVAQLPAVSDQDMGAELQQLSGSLSSQFEPTAALKELHIYINKYGQQVREALQTDVVCSQMGLPEKLVDVLTS